MNELTNKRFYEKAKLMFRLQILSRRLILHKTRTTRIRFSRLHIKGENSVIIIKARQTSASIIQRFMHP